MSYFLLLTKSRKGECSSKMVFEDNAKKPLKIGQIQTFSFNREKTQRNLFIQKKKKNTHKSFP